MRTSHKRYLADGGLPPDGPFPSIEVTRRSLCRPRRGTIADGELRLAACCGCSPAKQAPANIRRSIKRSD